VAELSQAHVKPTREPKRDLKLSPCEATFQSGLGEVHHLFAIC
jgi:hypothetical protein